MTATGELVGGEFDGLTRVMPTTNPPNTITVDAGYYCAREGKYGWHRYSVTYKIEYIKDNDGDPHMVYVIDNGGPQ